MIPLPVIFAIVSAVAGASGSYFWQEARYGKQIADIHSTHALAFAQAQKDAHDTTIRLQAAKDAAVAAAKVRLSSLAADLARTRSAADGLRNDLSTASAALPDATPSTVIEYASALATVSAECGDAIVEMAGNAEGHRIDALKLLEAWPGATKVIQD